MMTAQVISSFIKCVQSLSWHCCVRQILVNRAHDLLPHSFQHTACHASQVLHLQNNHSVVSTQASLSLSLMGHFLLFTYGWFCSVCWCSCCWAFLMRPNAQVLAQSSHNNLVSVVHWTQMRCCIVSCLHLTQQFYWISYSSGCGRHNNRIVFKVKISKNEKQKIGKLDSKEFVLRTTQLAHVEFCPRSHVHQQRITLIHLRVLLNAPSLCMDLISTGFEHFITQINRMHDPQRRQNKKGINNVFSTNRENNTVHILKHCVLSEVQDAAQQKMPTL